MVNAYSTVTDAVLHRMSVRSFKMAPVARKVIVEILEIARRAPSGGNLQPWQVDVLAGEELEKFKQMINERTAAGIKETPQYDVYPANLWDPYRGYRYRVGEDMYALIGIAREDKAGRLAQFEANFRFFGAPVALFFSLDRRFGAPQWADVGMFMQTVMLLAVERGLGTCAQEFWSFWPDSVAEYLSLSEDRVLFSGMALGYPDNDAPINQLRTARASVESFATLHGFEGA